MHSNADSVRRSGFESSKRITDSEVNSFEDQNRNVYDRRADRRRSPPSAHWRSSEDSVSRDGNMESDSVYKASRRNRNKREMDRSSPPDASSSRSRNEADDTHSAKRSRSRQSEEDNNHKGVFSGFPSPKLLVFNFSFGFVHFPFLLRQVKHCGKPQSCPMSLDLLKSLLFGINLGIHSIDVSGQKTEDPN